MEWEDGDCRNQNSGMTYGRAAMLLSIEATECTIIIDIWFSGYTFAELKLEQSLLLRENRELHALNVQIFLKTHRTDYGLEL